MLGRFICPVAKLAELEPYCGELFSETSPLIISALGRGGATAGEFVEGISADLTAIQGFLERQGNRAQVDIFEVRLPADVFAGSANNVRKVVDQATDILRHKAHTLLWPFFEVTLGVNWRGDVAATVAALRERNEAPALGFKLRCGGLEAAAFPSVEQVAFCIQECRAADVPFKATAGLHHPLPRYAAEVQTTMHGFINLFGAGVLAKSCDLKEDQIERILADDDASHFAFTDEHFSWGEWQVATEDIAAIRRECLICFGSCSFDEPRQDLRELGWL